MLTVLLPVGAETGLVIPFMPITWTTQINKCLSPSLYASIIKKFFCILVYFKKEKKKLLYRVDGVMGIISCKATEMVIYLRKTNTKPQPSLPTWSCHMAQSSQVFPASDGLLGSCD